MDTLIHADIFFFVTTIAVIVVTIAFTVALVYLIKVLMDIKEISEQVRQETVLFREDLQGLRSEIKQKGFQVKSFVSFFQNLTPCFRKLLGNDGSIMFYIVNE